MLFKHNNQQLYKDYRMSSLRGGRGKLFWYFVADVLFGLDPFDLNENHQGTVLTACIKIKENEHTLLHTHVFQHISL